jgi:hypothetical protein
MRRCTDSTVREGPLHSGKVARLLVDSNALSGLQHQHNAVLLGDREDAIEFQVLLRC